MTVFDRIFGQPSARVVALARLILACVFLVAAMADPRPDQSQLVDPTLAAYLVFSLVVACLTWRNWWIDARTAVAAHVVDVCLFMTLLLLPEGYSSPFFLFFVFLLLASAIRWQWKETALTASIVLALYLIVGLFFSSSPHDPFELRRFIIRCGYLFVLSAVLIWFGVRRRFSLGVLPPELPRDSDPFNDSPLAAALRQSSDVLRSTDAIADWFFADGRTQALKFDRKNGHRTMPDRCPSSDANDCFLFDFSRNRALIRSTGGHPRFTTAASLMPAQLIIELAGAQGIGVPVRNDLGHGLFLFWNIPDLHSDHLELGHRLSAELGHLIERHALFRALHEGAMARERDSLARDLHDGIVQFLAGATYKIEALSHDGRRDREIASGLQELKQLMLLEQEDLRSSIYALRKDKIGLSETAKEARSLSERLSRHWNVRCTFDAAESPILIPTRLHLDLLHVIKEGVANAVRHASAQHVDIRLELSHPLLRLIIRNDGLRCASNTTTPWSIRERALEANGTLNVESDDCGTTLSVAFPLPDNKL